MNELACRNCHRIVKEEGERCPYCGGKLSKNWKGYVCIIDVENSEIAKSAGFKSKGEYAVRVR